MQRSIATNLPLVPQQQKSLSFLGNKPPFCRNQPVLCYGFRGTPGWIAPEMYVQNLHPGQKHRSTVGTAADVYAAGWVFFEVLCGLSPLMFQEAKTDDSFAAGEAQFSM